jgi:putative transposase
MIRRKDGQSAMDYAWRSHAGGHAVPTKKRAKWLDAAASLKAFHLADTVAGRRAMVERLDKRAVREEIKSCGVPAQTEEVDQRASHLRRGWYWGTQSFGEAMRKLGQKLLNKTAPASRAYQKHELVREHGAQQAEAWLLRGAEGGKTETGQSRPSQRIRPEESAAGGPALAADGGVSGVAGGEAGDEIGGERKPTTPTS